MNLKEEFMKIFRQAGYCDTIFSTIPNEYCLEQHRPMFADWFSVNTAYGRIKIGCRKRVIHIELMESVFDYLSYRKKTIDLSELFRSEGVTKSEKHIHAWGWEDCKKYLRKIREACE